jgi:carbonic anhydrase
MGSLTTGDEIAKEGILWTIFEQPIDASRQQVEQLLKNYEANARATRPLNRRFLLEKVR